MRPQRTLCLPCGLIVPTDKYNFEESVKMGWERRRDISGEKIFVHIRRDERAIMETAKYVDTRKRKRNHAVVHVRN